MTGTLGVTASCLRAEAAGGSYSWCQVRQEPLAPTMPPDPCLSFHLGTELLPTIDYNLRARALHQARHQYLVQVFIRQMLACSIKIIKPFIRAHSSIIHNSQNVETTQVPTDGWINGENVVPACSGVFSSLAKEGNSFFRANILL